MPIAKRDIVELLLARHELERAVRADEELLNARTVAAGHYAVSLDRTMGADDADGQTIADRFTVTEPGFGAVEDALTLSGLMEGLDDRTREILRLRFEQDLTQSEIGERLGLSQMHISRLIREALRRMAEPHR